MKPKILPRARKFLKRHKGKLIIPVGLGIAVASASFGPKLIERGADYLNARKADAMRQHRLDLTVERGRFVNEFFSKTGAVPESREDCNALWAYYYNKSPALKGLWEPILKKTREEKLRDRVFVQEFGDAGLEFELAVVREAQPEFFKKALALDKGAAKKK
ncbi:MAG: hypothetical protein AABW99_00385 [archaeon]